MARWKAHSSSTSACGRWDAWDGVRPRLMRGSERPQQCSPHAVPNPAVPLISAGRGCCQPHACKPPKAIGGRSPRQASPAPCCPQTPTSPLPAPASRCGPHPVHGAHGLQVGVHEVGTKPGGAVRRPQQLRQVLPRGGGRVPAHDGVGHAVAAHHVNEEVDVGEACRGRLRGAVGNQGQAQRRRARCCEAAARSSLGAPVM